MCKLKCILSFYSNMLLVVTERLIERDQEPCIADKMKEFIQNTGLEIVCYTKKHTYPGKTCAK